MTGGAGAYRPPSALFTGRALAAMVSPPIYTRLILGQMIRIGYFSLPVVGLTAFFMGGVLALQIYLGGNRFGAEAIVPQVVVLGITRELGPVILGLRSPAGWRYCHRGGDRKRAKVTEQIDALTYIGYQSHQVSGGAAIVAAVISMPISTLIADSASACSAVIPSSVYSLHFTGSIYLKNTCGLCP